MIHNIQAWTKVPLNFKKVGRVRSDQILSYYYHSQMTLLITNLIMFKYIQDYSIWIYYGLKCHLIKYLSLLRYICLSHCLPMFHLSFHPHLVGVYIKYCSIFKPNISHNLVYLLYKGLLYHFLHLVIDLVHPNTSLLISFSGMYRK